MIKTVILLGFFALAGEVSAVENGVSRHSCDNRAGATTTKAYGNVLQSRTQEGDVFWLETGFPYGGMSKHMEAGHKDYPSWFIQTKLKNGDFGPYLILGPNELVEEALNGEWDQQVRNDFERGSIRLRVPLDFISEYAPKLAEYRIQVFSELGNPPRRSTRGKQLQSTGWRRCKG